jgi:hypothetical protein
MIPPKGWTTDKEEMEYDYQWLKTTAETPQPIIRNTRKSGNCMTCFSMAASTTSGNPIEGDIWEIVTSMDLGLKSLTVAPLPTDFGVGK